MHPVRLIFVARKFGNMAGGLERISIDLMNAMVRRGHTVALMTWDRTDAVTHYPLDLRVQWLRLDAGNPDVVASLPVKIARLTRFRKFVLDFKPDVILGFQSGASLFSRVATIGMGKKIVAAERVSPDMWKHVRTGFVHRLTDIYSLILADKITVQFESYIEKYPWILRGKMVPIHNPVFEPVRPEGQETRKESKILLYVARLCYQKNHRLLIDAFSRICNDFPEWKLVLVGDGEYDVMLRGQAARLGLHDRILFCGAVKDVNSWYRKSELVAFPSFFEGFPNALAESLSWGLPSVGLRTTLGVNTLIEDGVNGLLTADTEEAFADGLATLMRDDRLRAEMAINAGRIGSQYSAERSYDLWESLIEDLSTCQS